GESGLRLVRALAVEMHENWLEQHRYLNVDDLREHKHRARHTASWLCSGVDDGSTDATSAGFRDYRMSRPALRQSDARSGSQECRRESGGTGAAGAQRA